MKVIDYENDIQNILLSCMKNRICATKLQSIYYATSILCAKWTAIRGV